MGDISQLRYSNGKLKYGSFEEDNYQEVETTIDCITGGFPCTDISVAGKQVGLFDEKLYLKYLDEGFTDEEAKFKARTRSGLWGEYKRLIGEIRPRYILIENVAALRSNGLVTVLQDLWTLGYDAEWSIISARAIGACHLRERIWIIAYPNRDHLRIKSERMSGRRERGICEERKAESGYNGEAGIIESSDSHSIGRMEYPGLSKEIQSSGDERLQRSKDEKSSLPKSVYGANKIYTSNTDNLRFWQPFATKEEAQRWWAETTASQRDWWEAQSEFCGVDDAISERLDAPNERIRKQRIKQLGNSIVPGIAQVLGQSILDYEKNLLL